MSLIASTPQQICNSPLNDSKAKMLYTFSKSSKEIFVKKSDCSQAFYDLPQVKSSRAPAFGYGTKYDFTKTSSTNPSPNAYEIKSIFEDGKVQKKKGYSFGLSREAMSVTGGQFVGDKNSPGPGAYDTRETLKTTLSYSFRPRTTMEPLTSPKFVPGPGAYPVAPTINQKGKYQLSKFKNSCATLISPARSRRFVDLKSPNPGPGTYENPSTIKEDGSYFISKFRSSLCRTFSHSMRKNTGNPTFVATPGPGSYKHPSDFGYYESKKAAAEAKESPK